MEGNIFIPKKLKVGYNKRLDTYSKKLAYVTYYDDKGKLRKEASWTSWIEKDMGIDEFDNLPIEGFVLNRNVGGAKLSFGYDVRIEKVRVYDPRGFEIEIDIPNVLFILQECTSVKGKGLDGTFVYGWIGTKLTLIPTTCLEYKQAIDFTGLQSKSVAKTELIVGATYKTKKLKDLVYLGRFDWVTEKYRGDTTEWVSTKKNIFVDLNPNFGFDDATIDEFDSEEDYNEYLKDIEEEKLEAIANGEDIEFITLANTSTLATCVSDTPVSNYAELLERFSNTINAATPIELIEEEAKPQPSYKKDKYGYYRNADDNYYAIKDGKNYLLVSIGIPNSFYNKKGTKFEINVHYNISFNKGNFNKTYVSTYNTKFYGKEFTTTEINKMELLKLKVKLSNNKLIDIKQYI